MDIEPEVKKWIEKIEKSKNGSVDLSRDEDLSIGIMNLISLEEHFYFTAMKTNDGKYLDMLNSTRELRKKLLAKIVIDPKGEEWCISKHLLAASMRMMEVGTKELTKGERKEAEFFFKQSFNLYSLFFAINLNMISSKAIDKSVMEEEEKTIGRFSSIIKKIIDCCKE